MSAVKMEFDNALKKSEIIIPIMSVSPELGGEDYTNHNISDIDQTKVFGIMSPLVQINSTVVDFNAIVNFELKSVGKMPTLTMLINDRNELINNIDKPGVDNEVRVQILPKFDNVYKKIDLTFFISNISVNGNYINLSCTYKLPKLVETRLESFGNISTYNLFRNIALKTQLGFQTNIADSEDLRYVYCANTSYLDILDAEIARADASIHILDWWIDFWNNINLVDIKERYNTVDNDEDMKIWIASQINDIGTDTGENAPMLMPAIINNHPGLNNTELYVKSYINEVKPGINFSLGTDNVYSIYNENTHEHSDFLVQNGDVKRDTFTKYSYLGEIYSDYNYLLQGVLRDNFIKKINSEVVKVALPAPVFGLMRGGKVNFLRYVNNDILENKIRKLENIEIDGQKLVDRKISSNIPLDDYELDDSGESGTYKLDRTVSAQYLIHGIEIKYSNNMWEYILKLVKPLSANSPIISLDLIETQYQEVSTGGSEEINKSIDPIETVFRIITDTN
jgi:hypothetical protein